MTSRPIPAPRWRALVLLIAAGPLAAVAAAQDPMPSTDGGGPLGLDAALLFRAPIHTAPDDPLGGAYGIWASQADYKVAFDGGMVFHPALGRGVAAPWTWRTVAVEVGGRSIDTLGAAEVRHDDWQLEYHHGSHVEAYAVRAEGVEQTFRFAALPGGGDLVIRGLVTSGLRAAPTTARHGAIDFRDADGATVVRYGAATVFDAAGRSLPMTTSVTGATIELRVPADWLATATFPIVVDPLVQNTLVRQSSGNPVDVSIARDDESNELLLAYSRWIGDDTDGFALLLDDDYSNPTLIWSDVTNDWRTDDIGVAFVGGADHWLMASSRGFSSTVTALRYRTHPKGQRTFASTISFVTMPGGLDAYRPEVGGTAGFSTGAHGLVVFSAGHVSAWIESTNTEAYGLLIDAATGTAGVPFVLDASGGSTGGGRDRERENPCVNPENAGGTDAWVVAWQEFDRTIASDDWDIQASRVSHDGVPTAARTLGQSQPSRHSTAPKLAGRDGRYMLGFAAEDNDGPGGFPAAREVFAQRFNWGNALLPSVQSPRLVRQSFNTVLFPQGISYDPVSRSHWTFVTQGMSPHQVIYADLLGHRAGVCQALTVSPVVGNTDFAPAVAFDDDARVYRVVYGGTHQQVRGDTITYFDARTSLYGIGCGAGQIAAEGTPDEGAEFFTLRLQGLPAGTAAFLNLGLGPTSISLDTIGMPQCFANTDPNLYITSFTRVTGVGGAEVQLPLPAPLQGDLFAQWVYLSPGANALGVEATAGLRIEIR